LNIFEVFTFLVIFSRTDVVNIKKYASDLQTFLAVKQIEKDVETQDMCLQSIVNSDSLIETKLSCKIDNGLKTITTSIQQFGVVVVESMPSELTFVRKKEKQAQMMVAGLSRDSCHDFLTFYIYYSYISLSTKSR
jgi:hypothetical protein